MSATDPAVQQQKDRDQRKLLVGAGYNFLGSLGRIIIPLYYIVANHQYGPEVFGLYALAVSPTEILTSFVGSGFADAIQRFTARDADRHEATDVHYAVLWRCTWWVVLASGVAALLVVFGGRWLAASWDRPEAYTMLVIFGVNAPLVGVMGILLSGCRAVLDMKGDVLVRGFVAPVLLIVFALIFQPFFPNVYGLGLALTASNVVGVGAAIWYFRKHYSLRKLVAGRKFPAPRGLLAFAIPQSINMTIWQGLWNLDVLMLGAYVSDEKQIALYRIAAEIGRTVFGIRYSFSNVYAPLVARYTIENNQVGLQDSYTRLSRWISILAVPVVAIIILCQAQLLYVVNPQFDGGAAFLWLLLVGPLLACATGLSGNILVMTGHHFWNLTNSVLLIAVLAGLNVVLIPRYGMVGASIATMVAISGLALLQIAEVRLLNGVRVEPSRLWKPFAAGTLAFLAGYFAGEAFGPGASRLLLVAVKTVTMVVVYAGTLLALRLDPEDAELVAKWRARRAARAAR